MVGGNDDARYVVVFDPLDGSSNIDASIPTGKVRIVLLSFWMCSLVVLLLLLHKQTEYPGGHVAEIHSFFLVARFRLFTGVLVVSICLGLGSLRGTVWQTNYPKNVPLLNARGAPSLSLTLTTSAGAGGLCDPRHYIRGLSGGPKQERAGKCPPAWQQAGGRGLLSLLVVHGERWITSPPAPLHASGLRARLRRGVLMHVLQVSGLIHERRGNSLVYLQRAAGWCGVQRGQKSCAVVDAGLVY